MPLAFLCLLLVWYDLGTSFWHSDGMLLYTESISFLRSVCLLLLLLSTLILLVHYTVLQCILLLLLSLLRLLLLRILSKSWVLLRLLLV